MNYFPLLVIVVALAFSVAQIVGCSAVSEHTGSTVTERCVLYRAALAAAEAMPSDDPQRAARMAAYRELLAACPSGEVVE